MIYLVTILALASGSAIANPVPYYQRLTPSCSSCKQIEELLTKYDTAKSENNERLNIALKIAKIIKATSIKGKPVEERQRAIYFSIKASNEVLEEDFDGETVLGLIDLRTMSPKEFDYVLWHFPLTVQNKLVARMKWAKDRKLRPKAEIPVTKEVQ